MISLQDILPQSLDDEKVNGIIHAVDQLFMETERDTKLLALYERLDELPTAVLNLLAWQYHVDFFKYDMTDEVKRNLIRQSIAWHRIKGTPTAVEEMVTAIYATAEVEEWYQYDGEPFHFRVNIFGEAVTDAAILKDLQTSVYAVKNVRSLFDGFNFINVVDTQIIVPMVAWWDNTTVVIK
ncbi:phage tail protein I [uncultured Veillonella sp.]|uniref:phage tail protein I n=1 Tax=uncultured Veillonella sp. TaxID=159268 RepID=UPI0025952EB7|nr:phage tail protein I [uncultured Veillonella sp.]